MAKIVVPRNQQLKMAEEHPKPYYSRVIGMTITTKVPPTEDFVVTPVLGNDIWLLNVKVWVTPKPVVAWQCTRFQIFAGGGKNVGIEDVTEWEIILPLIDNEGKPKNWQISDGQETKEFSMMRFYSGQQRRFAMKVYRDTEPADTIQASLEISEG